MPFVCSYNQSIEIGGHLKTGIETEAILETARVLQRSQLIWVLISVQGHFIVAMCLGQVRISAKAMLEAESAVGLGILIALRCRTVVAIIGSAEILRHCLAKLQAAAQVIQDTGSAQRREPLIHLDGPCGVGRQADAKLEAFPIRNESL
jgi:hypothetical protein